jgi:hypothetical protein
MFVFVAATALPAVAAQTIRPEEAAKMFGARESVSSIDLFPDGRRLVYVAPTCGGASAAYLMDMAGGTPKPLIGSRRGAEEELAWCAFGSNTRLVCQLAESPPRARACWSAGRGWSPSLRTVPKPSR